MGLVQMYETQLRAHGMASAQVLLTHADLADRERYLNARSTLLTLLALKVIPVINENDTVVNDEIKFGDNDTLGALVANLVEADALVILTDQRGLYSADPRKDPQARFIDEAAAGDPALEAHGRRRRLAHRPRRHADQGAGRQACRRQRRQHRHRLGPRAATCCCAWPPARPSARALRRAHAPSWRRASSGWPTTCSCAARWSVDDGAVRQAARRGQEPAADRRGRGRRASSCAAT